MLICECCQIGNEEQIEEELDIGSLFVMLELGILEQSLVMGINWCVVWIRTLLRLSLIFFRIAAGMWVCYDIPEDSAKAERGGSSS